MLPFPFDAMAVADLSDPGAWRPLFAADIHLRVGSRPAVLGQAAAAAEVTALLARVRRVDNVYAGRWRRATGGAMVAEVELVVGDPGSAVPCAIVARVSRGLLVDLRFYLDPAPLLRGPAGREH